MQAQILRLGAAGRLKDLPPVLAFQSLVDATVSTAAVVHALFDQLDGNGSELVLFDINRLSGMEPFIDPASATILSRLTDASPRRYGRSLVTNADQDSLEVVERSIRPDRTEIATRPLGLAWPPEMFSLAHIALPFTIDDDVYGRNPRPSSFDVVRLGTLSPRGERAVLTVPLDTLMRVSSNPFFPYLAARLTGLDGRREDGPADSGHANSTVARTRCARRARCSRHAFGPIDVGAIFLPAASGCMQILNMTRCQ